MKKRWQDPEYRARRKHRRIGKWFVFSSDAEGEAAALNSAKDCHDADCTCDSCISRLKNS